MMVPSRWIVPSITISEAVLIAPRSSVRIARTVFCAVGIRIELRAFTRVSDDLLRCSRCSAEAAHKKDRGGNLFHFRPSLCVMATGHGRLGSYLRFRR